ncbi:FAD-binding protein, partial [Patescibacteria group bacterium]|nr:FAD-binding protein [Patescibacteria group bacterium]
WQEMLGLREFANINKIPYLILGGGSNILFADEGYDGLVIMNQMNKVQIHKNIVTAESAVNLTKLILICSQHNLGGISGLANVPGSVGGAVMAMPVLRMCGLAVYLYMQKFCRKMERSQ